MNMDRFDREKFCVLCKKYIDLPQIQSQECTVEAKCDRCNSLCKTGHQKGYGVPIICSSGCRLETYKAIHGIVAIFVDTINEDGEIQEFIL